MKNKRSFIGNILLGISFLTLSALSTRTGTGTNALALFLGTGILFLTGTVLKICSHEKHTYWKNIPSALIVSGGVFLLDLFLKWIMLDQQTLQSFGSVFFKVVTLYPLQPMDEMQYRSFDPAGLLFLTLLFQSREHENRETSLISALFQLIGENYHYFLMGDILVSTFPAFWYGSRPGIMRVFFDLVMGLVITIACNGYVEKKDPVNQKLWNTSKEFLDRTKKFWNILYYVTFGFLFFYQFFNTTMIPAYLATAHPSFAGFMDRIYIPMIFLSAFLAVISIFEADKRYEKNIISICLFLGFVFYGNSQNGAVYTMLTLTAGAVKKDGRIILSIGFIEGLFLMIVSWAGVRAGILTDVIVDNRHGLGIIYATDCYAHWFYLFVMYCLIRKGKFHWFEYPVTLGLFIWLYRLTRADTNLICFLIVWTSMLFRQYVMPKFQQNKKESLIGKVLVWSYVICAAVFFIALKNMNQTAPYLQAHFYTLWTRLYYSAQGLQMYKVKFLYQVIPEHGNGLNDYINHQFFYLDVSYIRILLMDGILIFGYIMGICTWFLNRSRKNRWGMLFIILCVIALQSMTEQRLSEYWYNILMILPLADFRYLRKE